MVTVTLSAVVGEDRRLVIAGHLVVIAELTTVEEYRVILSDAPVHIRARDLVNRHALRTLDALQLASALQATETLGAPMGFISADNSLLTAATAEGLAIDNPHFHP